ncbi:MAG: hypothetical protein ACYDAQ_16975 [Mycobacteriales bacterium]
MVKFEEYLATHNSDPKPLIWIATAGEILTKVTYGRVAYKAVNQ